MVWEHCMAFPNVLFNFPFLHYWKASRVWQLKALCDAAREIFKCHWFELTFIVSGDAFRVSEGGEDLKEAFDDGICCGGF